MNPGRQDQDSESLSKWYPAAFMAAMIFDFTFRFPPSLYEDTSSIKPFFSPEVPVHPDSRQPALSAPQAHPGIL